MYLHHNFNKEKTEGHTVIGPPINTVHRNSIHLYVRRKLQNIANVLNKLYLKKFQAKFFCQFK